MADRSRDRESFSPPAVGSSSLLVVFAVLCLTVFALLSLSTVRADIRLADRSAEAVTAYYEADTRAQEIFALLRAGETPDDVEVTVVETPQANSSDALYFYAVPMPNAQALQVQLVRLGDRWRVARWQMVSTGTWVPDESLNVWDGT